MYILLCCARLVIQALSCTFCYIVHILSCRPCDLSYLTDPVTTVVTQSCLTDPVTAAAAGNEDSLGAAQDRPVQRGV